MQDSASSAAINSKARLNNKVSEQLSQISYWRLAVNLVLMLLDMAMFVIAVAAVLVARNEITFYSSRFKFTLFPVVYFVLTALIWILCLHSSGVYHRHIMGDGYQLNVLIGKATVKCWFVLCACHFVLNMYAKLTAITLTVLLAALLTMIERVIARKFIIVSRKNGKYLYSTVLVGSPEGILSALKMLGQSKQLNYRPVAVCPIRLNENTGMVETETDFGDFLQEINDRWGSRLMMVNYGDRLAERIVAVGAQTVMVTDVLHRFSDNFNAFALQMESLNLEIALTASAVEISGHETQIRDIQGTSIMTIRLPQYSPYARICKRLFDIVVSLVAIILSSPIMLVVAALIKKEDGGPVFYTQERIGLRGKPFKIHKFRSMRVARGANEASLRPDQDRIFWWGKIMRRLKIDELPQLMNILNGTMSIVGPRPAAVDQVDITRGGANAIAATVPCGLTSQSSLWDYIFGDQFPDEEEYNEKVLPIRLKLDVYYVKHASFFGDIKLIIWTVIAILYTACGKYPQWMHDKLVGYAKMIK